MKFITLGMAALLAAGSIGTAYATPLVTNGDFSSTSPGHTTPDQFKSSSGTCGISGNNNWGGEFLSGWTTNSGYAIWYPSAQAASGTQACTQYGNTGNQLLPAAVTAPPTGPGTFVGIDGQPGISTSISQTIHGLTQGDKYIVSFYWASTQEMSRTGATTEQLQVSLGSQKFFTDINSIGTHGFSGWAPVSLTFTADATSEILSFLSMGTPSGFPPFALLSDVSMARNVPEPPVLAMFGGGLLGLGLLTMLARRRALRRNGADGDGTIG